MAIAGLEAVHTPSPDFPRWLEEINELREPDGTFGKGAGKAYTTGGCAAAILRMGMKLENRDAIISAIKAGQHDGGWSKDDGPPDLGASYRVMRALYMLREKPDVDRLMSFIKSCRQSDGSYASTPGGTGDMGGTYTATIITRWARLLTGLPAVTETAGFTPLVAAKDLTGWEGDKELWSVADNMIIGRSPGINHNEFLATTRPFGDFVLSLNFRMMDGKGNSGVQFRSIRMPNREMSGYQADIGEGFWGCLYDESRQEQGPCASLGKCQESAAQDRLEPLHRSSDGRSYHDRTGRGFVGRTTTRQMRASPGPVCSRCRFTPAGRWKCNSRT